MATTSIDVIKLGQFIEDLHASRQRREADTIELGEDAADGLFAENFPEFKIGESGG